MCQICNFLSHKMSERRVFRQQADTSVLQACILAHEPYEASTVVPLIDCLMRTHTRSVPFQHCTMRRPYRLPTHELPTGRQFRGRQFVMHHSTGLPTLIMKSYFDIQKCCCLFYFLNLYSTVPNFWERVKNLGKKWK